jgi:hypothetical protein
MTLIDIATYVCNLVNKTDDTSKTRCKEFVRQHHENVINSALWRETIDVEQTTLPFDGLLLPKGRRSIVTTTHSTSHLFSSMPSSRMPFISRALLLVTLLTMAPHAALLPKRRANG